MQRKKHWHVQLGTECWTRFTYPRSQGNSMRLIGSIACGAQMGALGESPDGYFQVNGDYVTPLNNSQVRQAIKAAKLAAAPPVPRQAGPRPAVVVKVKRHRIVGPK